MRLIVPMERLAGGGKGFARNAPEAARKLAAMGTGGDELLAHITPGEAMLLKLLGGSGNINPRTGVISFAPGDSEDGGYDNATGLAGVESVGDPDAAGDTDDGSGGMANDGQGTGPGFTGPAEESPAASAQADAIAQTEEPSLLSKLASMAEPGWSVAVREAMSPAGLSARGAFMGISSVMGLANPMLGIAIEHGPSIAKAVGGTIASVVGDGGNPPGAQPAAADTADTEGDRADTAAADAAAINQAETDRAAAAQRAAEDEERRRREEERTVSERAALRRLARGRSLLLSGGEAGFGGGTLRGVG